jgi:hypothetical protein
MGDVGAQRMDVQSGGEPEAFHPVGKRRRTSDYEIKQSANIVTLDFSWTASDRARPLFHAAPDYHWPWA